MTAMPEIGAVVEFTLDGVRAVVTRTWPEQGLLGLAVNRRELPGWIRASDVAVVPVIEAIDVAGAPGRSGAGRRGQTTPGKPK